MKIAFAFLLTLSAVAGFSTEVKQKTMTSFGDPKTAVLLPDYASNDPDPVMKTRATVSDTMSSLVHLATRAQNAAHNGGIKHILPLLEERPMPPAVAHLKKPGKPVAYKAINPKMLPDWACSYPTNLPGGKRAYQPSLMKKD